MTEENPEPEKKEGGFFKRLFKGLSKTRESIASGLDAIFSTSHIDEEFYEEMEELLITGDIGVNTTEEIIEKLREQVKQKHVKQPQECRQLLADIMTDMLLENPPDYDYEDKRSVVLVVGVNGAGKTTTIGKLASIMKKKGRTVMVAAADTFRAAAGEQLEVWVQRAGADFIRCTEGQDPASVVYDAMQSAKARNTDIVFCDTAGRLHNKKNLMQELEKIRRVISRENPDAFVETLIVLDGTTGQNALSQAREFMAVSQVTGAVITKLDGTAKGGIAIAIQNELGIPVKYIGVGEAIEDLQRFDARAFVEALFVLEKDSEDS
ncbi:MAG: signal recognition particle-docking protein FtsY [Lachnospiraceae bacterium]|nr:signal recognition particle-docking protein FtsY [Lachnospiraceae bacterium]